MNFKLLVLAAAIMLNWDATAFAKAKRSPQSKSKARAYSFYDDGGQSHQAGCDPEKKPKARLQRRKEFTKASGYMGSEVLDSVLQPDVEAWKHYFSTQGACESSLRNSSSFKEKTAN